VAEAYRQYLPDQDLSIERFTDAVPDDGGWYLIRSGERLGRFQSLTAAQKAWKDVLRETGWEPPRHRIDPVAVRRREQMERWARNRAG
jgi:hypothetical protein